MKKFKLTALLLSMVISASAAAACSSNSNESSDGSSDISFSSGNSGSSANSSQIEIGANKIEAELSQEINENETNFKLNAVIDAGVVEDGMKYLFFDITINNSTDVAYTLSTLNNFYILPPDGEEIYSAVRTQLHALNNFDDEKYFSDPFEIPANGTFSGVIGGFCVDENLNDFTVGFFPTKDDPRDKESVITVEITKDDIITAEEAGIMIN